MFRTADLIVSAFIFLVYVGFTSFSAGEGGDPTLSGGAGDIVRQIAFLGTLGALILLWRHHRVAQVKFPITLAVTILWCWLSLSWAIEPGIAFRRIALGTIIIVSAYLTVGLLGRDRLKATFAACLAVMMISDVVSALTIPGAVHMFDARDDSIVGAWRGLHMDKNAAGSIAAVACIVFFFRFIETGRKINLLWTALSAFFLWRTQSKTSMALVPLSIFAAMYFRFAMTSLWARNVTFTIVGCSTALAIALVAIYSEQVYNLLFLDPESFTGRTEIWNILLQYAGEHPLSGSGYGSFWNIGASGPSFTHGGWITDAVFVGHNGYLDVLAATGWIGLILTVLACVIVPMYRILVDCSPKSRFDNVMSLAIIVFTAMHNTQESSFIERDNPLWVALLFAIFMSRQTAEMLAAEPVAPEPQARMPRDLAGTPNRFRSM